MRAIGKASNDLAVQEQARKQETKIHKLVALNMEAPRLLQVKNN
jgi:hypothetical protein